MDFFIFCKNYREESPFLWWLSGAVLCPHYQADNIFFWFFSQLKLNGTKGWHVRFSLKFEAYRGICLGWTQKSSGRRNKCVVLIFVGSCARSFMRLWILVRKKGPTIWPLKTWFFGQLTQLRAYEQTFPPKRSLIFFPLKMHFELSKMMTVHDTMLSKTGGSLFIRICLIRNWGLSELFSKSQHHLSCVNLPAKFEIHYLTEFLLVSVFRIKQEALVF